MARNKRGRRTDATGRSKGDSKHVRFYEWELASPAFRSLSCNARSLLIEFKRLYNGENNGTLFLSVRRAAELIGVAKNTANNALAELQAHGFIRPTTQGSAHTKVRHATCWRLTEHECNGEMATKDFMKFGRHKHSTVPKFDTGCVNKWDTVPIDGTANTPICVKERDRKTPKQPSRCVNDRDTYNKPYRGAPAGTATTSPPPSSDQSDCDPDGHEELKERPPGAIGPRLQRKEISNQRKQARNPERPADVLDLEEWLDARPQISPTDKLRHDLNDHLERSPRGETARLAALIGLSRPQLANFKSGKFGLNKGATAQLRKILDEERAA